MDSNVLMNNQMMINQIKLDIFKDMFCDLMKLIFSLFP